MRKEKVYLKIKKNKNKRNKNKSKLYLKWRRKKKSGQNLPLMPVFVLKDNTCCIY